MIKFLELKHKESEIIIKYDEWLCWYNEYLNDKSLKVTFGWRISACSSGRESIGFDCKREYEFNELLFSDDFEITYGSNFTNRELKEIYSMLILDEDYCRLDTLAEKVRKEYNSINR